MILSRARRITFAWIAIVAASLTSAPFGCALNDTSGGGHTGQPCTQGHDEQCADDNPCHVPACNADGLCEFSPVSKDPADVTPGDCQRTHCVEDQPSTIADDGDPEDDDNPCTVDTCQTDRTTKHAPLPDGDKCVYQGHDGTCMSGACSITCQKQDDCSSMNPCVTGACNDTTNQCSFQHLDGVPSPDQRDDVPCSNLVCVKGMATPIPDASDAPPPANMCSIGRCAPGPEGQLQPDQTPKDAGEACQGGVCDGDGNCVACVVDADCPDPPGACDKPHCNPDHSCGDVPRPMGPSPTLDSQQTDGDCHRVECDGQGHPHVVVDTTDPADDGDPCTTDSCDAMGNQKEMAKGDGASCGLCLACKQGTCIDIMLSGQQGMTCDDGHGGCGDGHEKCACDGMGRCGVKKGDPCTQGAECASGSCAGNGKCS